MNKGEFSIVAFRNVVGNLKRGPILISFILTRYFIGAYGMKNKLVYCSNEVLKLDTFLGHCTSERVVNVDVALRSPVHRSSSHSTSQYRYRQFLTASSALPAGVP